MKIPRLISIVLTDKSRNHLKSIIKPRFSNKTLKDDQYMHHVTLAYNPSYSNFMKIDDIVSDGDLVKITSEFLISSDFFGVEALTIDTNDIPCFSYEPHITISTEGLPPVKSNDLLKIKSDLDDVIIKDIDLTLEGNVKYQY